MKRSRPSATDEDEDLISTLPEAVILHVLSFLDVKDVVKTSALSRHWSSLWTKTSSVSIDFRKNVDAINKDEISVFDRFIILCTSPAIRKLHLLNLNYDVDSKERIDLWIRFAVGRCIDDLCIQVDEESNHEAYILPRALLRCESLTRLRLESCGFPFFTKGYLGVISWSSLKVLSVHRTYMDDEVINGVLEGSSLLESMTLEACYGMDSIRISSMRMRELVICEYYDPHELFKHNDDDENRCLEIYAPYLRSLQLLGPWEGKQAIVLKEVSSLVEVVLNFCLVSYWMNSDIIHGTMKGILSNLRFVDEVVIGNEILMNLYNYKRNGDFSLLLKCRYLTITTLADKYSLGRIAELLECTPYVEKLVIDFDPKIQPEGILTDEGCSFNEEILRGTLWKCLTSHIKNIEIIVLPGHGDIEPIHWLSLIEVLLRDALALEKMVINVKCSWTSGMPLGKPRIQDLFKVAEDVLGYPRGSKAAKVVLNYPFKSWKSSS